MKFVKSTHPVAAAIPLLIAAGLPKDLNINDPSKTCYPRRVLPGVLTWTNRLDPERL